LTSRLRRRLLQSSLGVQDPAVEVRKRGGRLRSPIRLTEGNERSLEGQRPGGIDRQIRDALHYPQFKEGGDKGAIHNREMNDKEIRAPRGHLRERKVCWYEMRGGGLVGRPCNAGKRGKSQKNGNGAESGRHGGNYRERKSVKGSLVSGKKGGKGRKTVGQNTYHANKRTIPCEKCRPRHGGWSSFQRKSRVLKNQQGVRRPAVSNRLAATILYHNGKKRGGKENSRRNLRGDGRMNKVSRQHKQRSRNRDAEVQEVWEIKCRKGTTLKVLVFPNRPTSRPSSLAPSIQPYRSKEEPNFPEMKNIGYSGNKRRGRGLRGKKWF